MVSSPSWPIWKCGPWHPRTTTSARWLRCGGTAEPTWKYLFCKHIVKKNMSVHMAYNEIEKYPWQSTTDGKDNQSNRLKINAVPFVSWIAAVSLSTFYSFHKYRIVIIITRVCASDPCWRLVVLHFKNDKINYSTMEMYVKSRKRNPTHTFDKLLITKKNGV